MKLVSNTGSKITDLINFHSSAVLMKYALDDNAWANNSGPTI